MAKLYQTRTYNPNHQLPFLINLKIALKTLQIENLTKHLMTPYYMTTKEIKKYPSTNEN